jgi:hypothetical protein
MIVVKCKKVVWYDISPCFRLQYEEAIVIMEGQEAVWISILKSRVREKTI